MVILSRPQALRGIGSGRRKGPGGCSQGRRNSSFGDFEVIRLLGDINDRRALRAPLVAVLQNDQRPGEGAGRSGGGSCGSSHSLGNTEGGPRAVPSLVAVLGADLR